MRIILLGIIYLYQSYISPYKGFSCAYGVKYRNGTCSSKIKFIVLTEPLRNIPKLIYSQFCDCKAAYRSIADENNDKDKENNDLAKCFILECGANACMCM